ncbi:MAG: LacI family transcriptional regulator [Paenibacillaceae bacterium]|jgi:LacI family transcriptional regulator|nr:LacI family transcriptional regulator [Paenibacillaceae bacterium]
MATKKVSMQQIADAVGVSKYAVSKALAGKEGVSPQTREKIIEMATGLGYFRQHKAAGRGKAQTGNSESSESASLLARADKRSVAVLMPGVRHQTMESTFWSVVVRGIGEALDRLGLGMLIITEQSAEQFNRVLRPEMLLGLIGVGEISTSMLLEVRRHGIPFVLTDHEDPLVPADTIFAANGDCMAQMTGHLLALGHRSFWFLGDTRFSRSFGDRWTGFRKALEDREIGMDPKQDMLPVAGAYNEQNLAVLRSQVEARLGQDGAGPTAWVCANDEIALMALAVLRDRGTAVPGQVSVTGFDNIIESQRAEIPLTTVNVAKERLGARAVAALLDRVNDPERPVEKISLMCELVVRASSAQAPV